MDWHTVSENVPSEALPLMGQQLEQFGAAVTFDEPHAGFIESVAGSLRFRLDKGGALKVKLENNPGHFPPLMLIGGMRQFVEEAVEMVARKAAC